MRTGWNLPPGVTHQMIDDAFGGGDACTCDLVRERRTEALVREGFSAADAEERVESEDDDGELRCESCEYRRAQERAEDDAADARIDDAIERRHEDD